MPYYTKGFTLIELLITIGIITLIFTISTPLLHNTVAKNHAATEINRIVGAINLARHEAIKHHAIITLCASVDGHSCHGNWHEGMILFLDKKGNGSLDADDVLLRTYGPLPVASKLYWNSRNRNYLQMTPSGYLKGQNGTFLYCPGNKDNRYARAVILSQTGRVRLSSANDQGGIHEDADGKPLQC
ncbi:GspH/FimT family pseudopilin [soil metagenome]